MGKSAIEQQAEKVFRHVKGGSHGTKGRYKDSCIVFCRWLANTFKVQNLKNLQGKHLAEYVAYRKLKGIDDRTIKNDLTAIRYLHNHVPGARYELPTNDELKEHYGISFKKTPEIDRERNRAWAEEEFESFVELAEDLNRYDVAFVIKLSRYLGLRISEAVGCQRHQLEKAIREGMYFLETEAKNGRRRAIPVNDKAMEVIKELAGETPRGAWCFVPNDKQSHQITKSVQQFIVTHRHKIETEEGKKLRKHLSNGRVKELNHHGLRYLYTQERIQEELKKGLSMVEIEKKISKELGHNRREISRGYASCF